MLSTPNWRPWKRMDAAARTHAGKVRTNNEDALLCKPDEGLFAVVDGMGGEESGEVAAAIAIATLAQVADQKGPSETLLARAMAEARERILADGAKNPLHASMGAVATAMRFEDNGRFIGIAHVGDTRLYKVDRRGVRVLTTDHVQPMPDQPGRQAVARDLGRKQMQEDWVQTGRHPVGYGDLLVLCSDGLHGPVEPKELESTLLAIHSRKVDADSAAQKLVALALARGGPDNVTVVVVRVARFRRGPRVPRLTVALAVPVLVLLIGLAMTVGIWGGLGAGLRRPATLPSDVQHDTFVKSTDPVAFPPGEHVDVAPGRLLDIRGADLSGVSWTIHVGKGAHVRIDRAVLRLDGTFRVELDDGSDFTLVDSRVQVGALTIAGPVTPAGPPPHVDLLGLITTIGSTSTEGVVTTTVTSSYGTGLDVFSPPAPPSPAPQAPTAP